MPRLPGIEDLGSRPVPSGAGAGVSLNLSTPRTSPEFEAAAELGASVSQLGNSIHGLIQREKAKNDDARNEEATSEYLNGLLELELNKETGFTNILGGDAVKNPVLKDYRKHREELEKRIVDGLDNDEQVDLFRARAQVANRQFDTRVYRHVAEQSRVYRKQTFEGGLDTERQMAALNWNQPGQVEMSVIRVDNLINKRAQDLGLNPERPADLEVINGMKRGAETSIHSSVIDQMLQNGQDLAARVYFSNIEDRLTPEAIIQIGGKLEIASTANEAFRATEQIWAEFGPSTPNDPVRLDVMLNKAQQAYGDNSAVRELIEKELRTRSRDHDYSKAEINSGYVSKMLDVYQKGASLQDIQRMPEYWAANSSDRQKLSDYIVDRGYTQQQRARAEAAYEQGARAQESYGTYLEFSNPEVLRALSRDQVRALLPVLGGERTEKLLAKQEKLSSGDIAYEQATIDEDKIKVMASEAGLAEVYTIESASAEEKEAFGRFKYGLERALTLAEEQARASGKTLSRAERDEILQSTADEMVMTEVGFPDPEVPAIAATRKQKKEVYVPIERVREENPQWIGLAINIMRSEGIAPMGWTDEQIIRKYGSRLERAYGHSVTGGSAERGMEILRGD